MASLRQPKDGFQRPNRLQDRPSLLPSNRKLRNLLSISLRNIVLPQYNPGRPRGLTIDDDADPKTFISPGKLRALREERALEHSQSSSDLRRAHTEDSESLEASTADVDTNSSPKASKGRLNGSSMRTRPKRPRRRSTLEWMNAASGQREEKLEHIVEERMANVFFSLHVDGINEPIYISETVYRTMDPTFRSLDLSHCASGIMRQPKAHIRIWAQSLRTQQWRMLSDVLVYFSSLRYLGKSLDYNWHNSEQNTIIFQFRDGLYTLPASLPLGGAHFQQESLQYDASRQRRSSTFDALLRLAKLTDSIEDALATRNMLATQLDDLISSHKAVLAQRDQVGEIKDRLKTIDFAKATVVKQMQKAQRHIEEKQASLSRRRALMAEDHMYRDAQIARMYSERDELPHLRGECEMRKIATAAQRRRIVEELSKLYTIDPLQDGKTLAFKIRSLPLPNAEDLDGSPPATVAAALGFAAHATQLLSFYLDIPLPYPVSPMGSSSWITDPISLLTSTATSSSVLGNVLAGTTDKAYPLHTSRVARFRFEYGLFLLNKDIQILLEVGYGVRVMDIRQTLPNLKYLFYVATAGEGEMPARKAGGVRGLMKDSLRHSLSRASSSSSLTLFSGKVPSRDAPKDGTKAIQSLKSLVK